MAVVRLKPHTLTSQFHIIMTSLLVILLSSHHTCSSHGTHNDNNQHNKQNHHNNCPTNFNENGASSIDLRLSKTKVPSSDTTYICQTFDLPTLTSDHHIIAVFPLIDAKEVVHHILLFGCDPRVPQEISLTSQTCGIMPLQTCQSLVGTWTMGSTGDCAHPEMGFRVGPRGYRQVYMQVHFNNPKNLQGIMDSSGLRVHMTPSLRPNDAGMLVVGQRSLQINPLGYQEGGQDTEFINANTDSTNVTFTAECPSRCTQHMFGEKGIFITSAMNHMHALGVSQHIEIYRNGSLVHTVTDQHGYIYDHPVSYTFPDPIHVLPGDELKTTCVYKRPTSKHPVCFGEATSDEMCFGFLTYFPNQNLEKPWCTSMGSMISCDRHLPQLGKHPISDCRWWEFRDLSHSQTRAMLGNIQSSCYTVQGSLECSDVCKTHVAKILSHPCLQNDVGSYMMDRIKKYGAIGQMLMDALVTCSDRCFRYCDRKLPNGFLGGSRPLTCPSKAALSVNVEWLGVLVLLLSSLAWQFLEFGGL